MHFLTKEHITDVFVGILALGSFSLGHTALSLVVAHGTVKFENDCRRGYYIKPHPYNLLFIYDHTHIMCA